MSTEAEKRAIKDELVHDRMTTLDQVGAVSGRSLSGKQREKAQRESEEIARRIVAGEGPQNRERYRRR